MPEVKVTFDAADDYERFMGQWSRTIGERFLTWLAPPVGARWLDVGCGTGAFSELIQRHCAPSRIDAIDPSQAQIEYARKLLPDIKFWTADSMDLPFADQQFDVVASALVIHFIADRAKAFSEMRRVLRPGGTVAGIPRSAPRRPTSHPMYRCFAASRALVVRRCGRRSCRKVQRKGCELRCRRLDAKISR